MEREITVVFKTEIETLCGDDGLVSKRKMENLAMVCTNIRNSGVNVLLVSSGAIAMGAATLNMNPVPRGITAKQAVAAVGQAELINAYQDCFEKYGQTVAQVLITSDVTDDPVRNINARNTFGRLLQRGVIPIINENDSVSTSDIVLNDNYPLALIASSLTDADAIVVNTADAERYLIMIKGKPSVITASTDELIDLFSRILQDGYKKTDDNDRFPGFNEYAGATLN